MESRDERAKGLTLADVEMALSEAEALRKRKEYRAAIDLLVDALEAGLLKPTLYYRLGNVYYDAGRLDLAEYAYKRAIEFQPDHLNAHHNLAVVYRRLSKIEASVQMRRKAYQLEFKHRRPHGTMEPDQRQWMRGVALRMFLLTVAVITVFGVVLYALSHFL